jgi:hypothetical protein
VDYIIFLFWIIHCYFDMKLDLSVEQSVECLAGETEVLGENLPQCRFFHFESHMT